MSEVVLITGASAGIGAALGEVLAARGHAITLVARRAPELHAVAARCGDQALPIVADVTQRAEVRRAIDTAIAHFGRVDVIVNNVGRGISRLPSALSDADVDEMIAVNVKPALYGMQEILPHFAARGTGQIVNVSSMLGRVPFATIRSAYCGAKHFLNALTATFRDELRTSHPGVVVSLVSPGVVYTEFGVNAVHGGPDSRALPGGQEPEVVARVIADVIANKATDVYTIPGSRERVLAYLGAAADAAL
ncbi:MAG: SDR family oxidoreductase [Gemmatimonadaceae bacterium]|jgi:NADP-dependent 3-hydroxy acid dehydrogenase YdfG|nr:SDR family oxidoreductase [Gemmatimonadaceae bacterium]